MGRIHIINSLSAIRDFLLHDLKVPFSPRAIQILSEFTVEESELRLSPHFITADKRPWSPSYQVQNLVGTMGSFQLFSAFCTQSDSGKIVNITITLPKDIHAVTSVILQKPSGCTMPCTHGFIRFCKDNPRETLDQKYRGMGDHVEKGWFGPVVASGKRIFWSKNSYPSKESVASAFHMPKWVRARFMVLQVYSDCEGPHDNVDIGGLIVKGIYK